MARDASEALASQIEFTRVHELVHELRIAQAMTRNVFTLGPRNTLRDAKELCRVNRISGVPIVDDNRLIGIVSVEDIILALERDEIDLPLGERMTGTVMTVREEESVVRAVQRFAQRRFGRLPVVDEAGRLVGIITRGDIVRGLLQAIDIDFRHSEMAIYKPQYIFDDLVSDATSVRLHYAIARHDLARGGTAAGQIKKTLARLDIEPRVARRVAIAAYEAEMNVIIHADNGGRLTATLEPTRIIIDAEDDGPGIVDLEKALQTGFSTAPDWVRELGFGAGMGLSNIRGSADEFHVDTGPGKGTHLRVVVNMERRQ
ncbi:MAG: CBS domain-containing protein [Chloroflexota bacterium]